MVLVLAKSPNKLMFTLKKTKLTITDVTDKRQTLPVSILGVQRPNPVHLHMKMVQEQKTNLLEPTHILRGEIFILALDEVNTIIIIKATKSKWLEDNSDQSCI